MTEPTMQDHINSGPDWMHNMYCPICEHKMTAIKIKPDNRWGENIVYQCHSPKGEGYCLTVAQVTTRLHSYMKPENFTLSDVGWRSKAEEVLDQKPKKSRDKFKVIIPPDPYQKMTAKAAVWRSLWDEIKKSGQTTPARLKELAGALYKDADKVSAAVSELSWIEKMSGYKVEEVKRGIIEVSGLGKGNINMVPFSDPDYRKKRGMR